jgi:hypothetical protein
MFGSSAKVAFKARQETNCLIRGERSVKVNLLCNTPHSSLVATHELLPIHRHSQPNLSTCDCRSLNWRILGKEKRKVPNPRFHYANRACPPLVNHFCTYGSVIHLWSSSHNRFQTHKHNWHFKSCTRSNWHGNRRVRHLGYYCMATSKNDSILRAKSKNNARHLYCLVYFPLARHFVVLCP